MKQLTLEESRTIIESFVKSFGQRGAARKLTERGYRSPEGRPLQQGHISRILAGSYTMLQAPEEPPKAVVPAPISIPEATYSIGEPTPEHCLEQGPAPASPPPTTTIDLRPEPGPREDLEGLEGVVVEPTSEPELEDLTVLQEDEVLTPLTPNPGDHTSPEHRHLERDVRISAVFNRRGEVQLDEDRGDFFGVPRLARQPQKVITKPHEARSYAKLPMSPTEPYRLQSKKSEIESR
ncbi:MAG: hypothetical protein ACYDHX_12750 [Methanothrix sp.]